MKIFAKYTGATIGPEGNLQRWAAPHNKFVRVCSKIGSSPKSLVERLLDYKIYALTVLECVGSLADPDEATLKGGSRA